MLKKIWWNFSEFEKLTLLLSVLILTIFIGLTIKDSSSVSLNRDGLAISKTAIVNQAQLKQALLLIELRERDISEIKDKAIALEKRTGVGGKLVEDLKKAEANFPPEYVRELEQTIEQSESVLNREMRSLASPGNHCQGTSDSDPDSNYDQGN